MHDPKSPKPGVRPGTSAPARPAGTPPAAQRPSASGRDASATPPPEQGPTGRVRHDERGNAVWDWLAQTSRVCVEATSRLLKKLETPELKIEDTKDEELRIMPEPSTGGGYDPYNQATKPPKSGRK
ncbi:MAG TPA: hypothetical protein VMG33_01350 [Steroidobacteraceae bacterium]|nr:hypothetical protein [Steroidobacteraceae bacterium]